MCVKRHIQIDTQQNMYSHVNMGTDAKYDRTGKIPVWSMCESLGTKFSTGKLYIIN